MVVYRPNPGILSDLDGH